MFRELTIDDYTPIEEYSNVENVGGDNSFDLRADYTRAFVYDNELCAVFGINPIWDGVGQVWGMVFPGARGHARELIKDAKEVMHWAMNRHNLHQVRSIVSEHFHPGHRFAVLTGFEVEGIMYRAGVDGSNVFVYRYERRN